MKTKNNGRKNVIKFIASFINDDINLWDDVDVTEIECNNAFIVGDVPFGKSAKEDYNKIIKQDVMKEVLDDLINLKIVSRYEKSQSAYMDGSDFYGYNVCFWVEPDDEYEFANAPIDEFTPIRKALLKNVDFDLVRAIYEED